MNAIRLISWLVAGAITTQLLLFPADVANAQSAQMSGAQSVVTQININKATMEELEALKGVGPSLAERIVAYRDEFGKFTSVDELTAIRGIGDAKLERIRAQIKL